MAGLGRKVFNAGEVLSAANVQGYLQDQVVQVYSGTAARSSALGTAVSEGMTSYLTDSNELSVYTSNGTAAWSPVNLSQSVNVILNSAFDIWQRGTSLTKSGIGNTADYLADRFRTDRNDSGVVISQQAFTAGTAPVSGYESSYFLRNVVTSVAGSGNYVLIQQPVEDVRTFAGQNVTFSFYAKADAVKSVAIEIAQNFGSGGSSAVNTAGGKIALTTSWARYSVTIAIPSVSGKTIGASSYLSIRIWLDAGSSFDARTTTLGQQSITFDLWGVQLEAGSVATPFRRNAPSLQGELAACQRYYWRSSSSSSYEYLGNGIATSTTQSKIRVNLPVTMRIAPTSVEYSTLTSYDGASATLISSLTIDYSGRDGVGVLTTNTGNTQWRPVFLMNSNSAAGYIGFSAEL